eukprot:NODE_5411_length_584_cov_1.444234.p5 GENE.NODE_5411_length_584_cov_1.444234~~NODE_5411_length_584_cov_1.444234.p5  ORF type:complete len:89 (+),score=25.90 NODE_5411_length_584_cov_1.444234:26-268(+)
MALGLDGGLLGPRRTPVLTANNRTIQPEDFTLGADGTPLGRDGEPVIARDGTPLRHEASEAAMVLAWRQQLPLPPSMAAA